MDFTMAELLEANRQIGSTLHKLRETSKTLESKENAARLQSQITLARRRTAAFELAERLIAHEIECEDGRDTAMLRPKQVVQLWVDAFNEGDVDAIVGLYHSDAINHQVANEPVAGADAIRRMFAAEFSAAKMVCIVENIFEDGQWAILEWRDPLGLRGCGFFQIVNGKIQFQRGYWDKLSFMKQHNLSTD